MLCRKVCDAGRAAACRHMLANSVRRGKSTEKLGKGCGRTGEALLLQRQDGTVV